MSLPKLDAIIQAAEDATPRPWRHEGGTSQVWGRCNPDEMVDNYVSLSGMGVPVARGLPRRYSDDPDLDEQEANAAYIVQAANLAEDMAKRLKEAYELLEARHDCEQAPEECTWFVAVEERFEEEGESA